MRPIVFDNWSHCHRQYIHEFFRIITLIYKNNYPISKKLSLEGFEPTTKELKALCTTTVLQTQWFIVFDNGTNCQRQLVSLYATIQSKIAAH